MDIKREVRKMDTEELLKEYYGNIDMKIKFDTKLNPDEIFKQWQKEIILKPRLKQWIKDVE